MADQSFSSHAKWRPAFHFFSAPLGLFALGYATNGLRNSPSVETAAYAALAGLAMMALVLGRTQALGVQDRVIRLEERLRLKELLPEDLSGRIHEISTDQLIGMRFASDAELPDLARRVLAGEFADRKSIKAAIKNWKADHQRV